MKKTVRKQLWIAFKIWSIALFSNTVLGTALLTHFFTDISVIREYVTFGLLFGAIASFPVFIILFLIINRGASKRYYGKVIFIHALVTGITLTAIVFFLFFYWCNFYEATFSLFACALFSGIIGITSQHKSITGLEEQYELYEEYLFKD